MPFFQRVKSRSFYMLRHGETQANVEGWAAGTFDTPLTSRGRDQACAARRVLDALDPRPGLIVHSPLSRARDTATILNENLHLPLVENALMAEQNFGDWKGLPWQEIHDRIMAGQTPPRGESMEMLVSRVMEGLSEILAMPEAPVLIVTHGGVFDALHWSFGYNLDDVKNCHLYAFLPGTKETSMPWEIWHYESSVEGGGLAQPC